MSVSYSPQSSIEGAVVSLKARKINLQLPRRNTYTKLKVSVIYPYKLDRNSEAVILKELKPKKFIIRHNSMLSVGDKIKGDMISGLSTVIIKLGKAKIKRGSGTHKASFLSVKGFIFAKLEKSFASLERKANMI
ncbi:MAG: hypothetical protein Q8M71_05750 [Thermodesulfovibrionales bacterium]|nr:hypothetical protein [Thermodesulfovibrionales bacterium]